MTTKHLATAILALAVVGCAAGGQSLSDLLQRGIYTQETVGDLDTAVKIYRQIINSAGESRAYAAQAQYRLGLCLKAKGDSAGASQAFQKLVKDYPEQKDLAAKAQPYLPQNRSTFRLFSVVLPHGWSLAEGRGCCSTSNDLTVVNLHDPEHQASPVRIWADANAIDPAEIDNFLLNGPARKEHQRRVQDVGPTWTIRPQSIRRFLVGGRPAQSAIADYVESSFPKVEFMTWIRTTKVDLIVFAMGIEPADLDDFLARFQPIVDSLVVP